jgi:hypothetical protein
VAFPNSEPWLETAQMAALLGIHRKTLLRLRSADINPFNEGEHYRRAGLTCRAPIHWHPIRTEEAFTGFKRTDPASIEAFSQEGI